MTVQGGEQTLTLRPEADVPHSTRLGNSEGLLSGTLYDPERPGPTESCLTDVK